MQVMLNVFDLFGTDSRTNSNGVNSYELYKENERKNLLLITRMVLRSFIDATMKRAHTFIDGETQQLIDLLVMIEKILWHGFRSSAQSSFISIRTADTQLWNFIERASVCSSDMRESVHCVNNLRNLTTNVARLRAFLRLALMQKKLGDYFEKILQFPALKNYYEAWAMILDENCTSISGALIGLSVFDCNLLLDQKCLQEQLLSIDFSLYIRRPSCDEDEYNEMRPTDLILDQKCYVEERNRYLENAICDLKKKLEEYKNSSAENVIAKTASSAAELPSSVQEFSWISEKAIVERFLAEKDDTISALQQQVADTKKVMVDLYKKTRIADDQFLAKDKEFKRLAELHAQEVQKNRQITETLKSKQSSDSKGTFEMKEDVSVALRSELAQKTNEYMDLIQILHGKQEELSNFMHEIGELRQKNMKLFEKLQKLENIEKEYMEMAINFEQKAHKLEECEKALEELGGHLSASKLLIIEMKEEMFPLTEAQWENDGDVENCKRCKAKFSVSRRRHHCRSCGSIFCNSCSSARVKLPFNPKPVRVCLQCYNYLHDSQQNLISSNRNDC